MAFAATQTQTVNHRSPLFLLQDQGGQHIRSSPKHTRVVCVNAMTSIFKPKFSRGNFACSAAQNSSSTTAVVATEEGTKTSEKAAAAAAPKPKAAAKAPAKPLPQLMEEEVIPALRAILEAQEDLSDIEVSFNDNKLEGSFLKKGNPYSFWAFFPTGALTGPKGFSLSSYGSRASTVEPFLVDEKKVTAKHVIFWVEKRLAAQGILPVWTN